MRIDLTLVPHTKSEGIVYLIYADSALGMCEQVLMVKVLEYRVSRSESYLVSVYLLLHTDL